MNIYIVTYTLVNDASSQKNSRLIDLIKEEGIWARLGDSSYLVQSDFTSVQLRDKYKQALEPNDILYVGRVTVPAAWSGYSDEVSKWIIEKLKKY